MSLRPILLAIVIAAIPAAAGNEGDDGPRNRQTLYYAAGLGVDRLNPMLKAHGWCEASSMIFNRLYRVGSNGKIEYDLLESATFSQDLLTLTLELKDNVQWHDGAMFTSADVVLTFDLLFDPRTPTDLDMDLRSLATWTADGPHRVLLTFKHPDPHIDGRLSEIPMLPAHILKGGDPTMTAFSERPIGTGAFVFDRRESRDVLWLMANGRYHEGAPAIKRVRLETIRGDEDRARSIGGGLNDMGLVKLRHASHLSKLGPTAIRRYKTGAWRGMPINLRNPVFQDVRVRRAIALSIDREPLVSVAADGSAEPAYVPIVPGTWAYPDNVKIDATPNPAAARTLLEEAGWSKGVDGIRTKDGRRLVLRMIVWKDEAFRRRAAEILKTQLAAVGIEVQLNLFDNHGYNENASDMGDSFDAFIGGWGGLSDPVGNIYRKFHTQGSQNHMGYSNAQVDRLIDRAMLSSDHRRAKSLLREAIERVLEDAVFIPLIYPEYTFAMSRRIENLPAGPVDSWYEITKHAYAWRITGN